MFLGQFRHKFDAKGRLSVPAQFRAALADGAVLTRGFENNLMLLTQDGFQAIWEYLAAMSLTDPLARALRRLIFAQAAQVSLDSAGRILVPPFLREAVGLDGEVVVVGAGDYIELWPVADWEAQMDLLTDPQTNAERFAALSVSTRPATRSEP